MKSRTALGLIGSVLGFIRHDMTPDGRGHWTVK